MRDYSELHEAAAWAWLESSGDEPESLEALWSAREALENAIKMDLRDDILSELQDLALAVDAEARAAEASDAARPDLAYIDGRAVGLERAVNAVRFSTEWRGDDEHAPPNL